MCVVAVAAAADDDDDNHDDDDTATPGESTKKDHDYRTILNIKATGHADDDDDDEATTGEGGKEAIPRPRNDISEKKKIGNERGK